MDRMHRAPDWKVFVDLQLFSNVLIELANRVRPEKRVIVQKGHFRRIQFRYVVSRLSAWSMESRGLLAGVVGLNYSGDSLADRLQALVRSIACLGHAGDLTEWLASQLVDASGARAGATKQCFRQQRCMDHHHMAW